VRTWTREQLEQLMSQHRTQAEAAKAAGITQSCFSKALKRHGIKREPAVPVPSHGNAAWQALGR
jgi:predicted amidophosphoribosyltransferase